MSVAKVDYEQLLRDAIARAKAGVPTVAGELVECASRATDAIRKVTNGAADLYLSESLVGEGGPRTFFLFLRAVNQEGPPSDLGVYQLAEAGYPIQRWYSRSGWEKNPKQPEHLFANKGAVESHFQWMISDPSSRLVVLVAFIMQQAAAGKPSANSR
jgi:hypothetical protein